MLLPGAMWPLIPVGCTGCGSPQGPLSGVLNPHSPVLGLCGLPAPYPVQATYGLHLGCKSKLGPRTSSRFGLNTVLSSEWRG